MWARTINAALGVWLMVAPAVLGYGAPARTNDYIVGPVAAAFAVIAMWEATRGARWVNLALGLGLLLAPLVLGYAETMAIANSMIVGALLAIVAAVRGKITHRFGGGWAALWKRNKPAQS